MNIFNSSGNSGILICLSLLLLISGVILLYCIRRFNVLENAIIEQGKVLQTYICQNHNFSTNNTQLANTDVTDCSYSTNSIK